MYHDFWSSAWQAKSAAFDNLSFARIIAEHRDSYVVANDDGEWYAEITGRLRFSAAGRAEVPAVGDWIAYRLANPDFAIIHGLLPRYNAISRKVAGHETQEQVLAANVDTVLIVTGPNREFNVNRLRRFLFVADQARTSAVIVLNKADLAGEISAYVRSAEALRAGLPVVVTSALENRLDSLRPHIERGTTAVMLGSSGVGKTTLVNALLGSSMHTTRAIRPDDKGRHTTTSRQLLLLPSGGCLIDTPGLRELQLWTEDEMTGFEIIDELALSCRFSDCSHRIEPGCAVLEALQNEQIDTNMVESFYKFRDEIAYLRRRQDHLEIQKAKRESKKLARSIRAYYRHNPKNDRYK